MKHWKSLSGTAAFLIAAGGTAQADVTSAQVWEAWKSMAADIGETMTAGSESQDGGTLTVSDVQISMETTDASASATIPEIVFTEQGDGTVAVTMSPSYDLVVGIAPEDAEAVDLTLGITSDGLSMIASGTPDAVSYDYGATSITVTVGELVVDGDPVDMSADIVLSDLSGTYASTGDAEMTSDMNAASLDVTIHVDEPDNGGGTFDAKMTYADVNVTSVGSVALMAGGVKELSTALAAGQSSKGSITHGAATYTVDFVDGSDQFSMTGSAEGGSLEGALSADALSYSVGNTGLDMTFSGSEIPLPEVAVSLGELGFGFLMPASKSEEPQDFALNLTLADLSVSEMIWSLIDQGGQLPHDPATLILDVAGKANFLVDIFDPEAMAMAEMDMPAEIHALDLNQLKLAIAGAVLTGSGGFTFDMDNMETFEGMPAPTGKITLQLDGGNALLDNLVAMGIVPEDQAMGARMMLGLFARPGEGDDSLVSEIEVDGATGAISANGQRLQ